MLDFDEAPGGVQATILHAAQRAQEASMANTSKFAYQFLTRAKSITRTDPAAVIANIGRQSSYLNTLIRDIHTGFEPLKGRNFAVFVTYSDMPYVSQYVYRHLDFLNENGFNVVVLSNSRKINEDSLTELKRRSIAILERPNIGYDFGAYRDGLIWIMQNFTSVNRMLLLNDSVFGPVDPESDFLRRALNMDADIVGLVESMEPCYHFQSFWLMFNRTVLYSDTFLEYWRAMPYYQRKKTVIDQLETKLVSYFLKSDFRAEALFPADIVTQAAIRNFMREIELLMRAGGDAAEPASEAPSGKAEINTLQRLRLSQRGTPLRARLDYLRQIVGILNHGVPMNPSIFMWRTLLQDFAFPYVKREIFTKNPVSEPNILLAYDVVESCGYPVDLIRSYLRGAR